ncbi:hypothetical protein QGM71_13695 [Virgibacillus sp. C22-A2]|uniref:Uncharacterized protein n=1 Tax=Virgibacillus tibetensis TaxID=3042313 RepID=A0ABU6KJJ4_9BACI|nr:hypothetical protein [Virgibacillus sp. C22-A2]
MIRYWKLISIVSVIVLAIGTFYIQSAVALSNYPRFVFQKISGDEEEVENIKLQGSYHDEGMQDGNLHITSDETVYYNELSFLERLGGVNQPSRITRLREEHRNFMRGKDRDLSMLYDDESMIGYANVAAGPFGSGNRDFEIKVEVLDKKSNSTTKFTVDLPEKERYRYVYVEDVQIVNGEMKVITRNYSYETNSDNTEMHLYSLDIGGQKVVGDDVLITSSESYVGGAWSAVEFLDETHNLSSSKYIVYNINHWKDVQEKEGNYYQEKAGSEISAYHMETGKHIQFELPEEISQANYKASVDGSIIYFSIGTETGFEVIAFNMDRQKEESSQRLEITRPIVDIEEDLIKVKDGKVYISSSNKAPDRESNISVIDLESGKLLYEGFIELEKQQSNRNYSLYIHQMIVEK